MALRQHLGFEPSAKEISCRTAARFPRGNGLLRKSEQHQASTQPVPATTLLPARPPNLRKGAAHYVGFGGRGGGVHGSLCSFPVRQMVCSLLRQPGLLLALITHLHASHGEHLCF